MKVVLAFGWMAVLGSVTVVVWIATLPLQIVVRGVIETARALRGAPRLPSPTAARDTSPGDDRDNVAILEERREAGLLEARGVGSPVSRRL